MPGVPPTSAPLRGAFGADLHLSDRPPGARGETRSEWYEFQEAILQKLMNFTARAPVFLAGDVFHSWKEPAELVNHVLETCSKLESPLAFSVRGNHDTPDHDHRAIHRSPYQTLVHARCLRDLGTGWNRIGKLMVHGFGYGTEIEPPRPSLYFKTENYMQVAVVHHFCWADKRPFPGVAEHDHARHLMDKLTGIDYAFFGDNHRYFCEAVGKNRPMIVNCGCLMKRRADERELEPSMWLLYGDGEVIAAPLCIPGEKWRENLDEMVADLESAGLDPAAFLETVRSLGDVAVRFGDCVERYLSEKRVRGSVARKVRQIMEAVG
jgi:hypothetical protein